MQHLPMPLVLPAASAWPTDDLFDLIAGQLDGGDIRIGQRDLAGAPSAIDYDKTLVVINENASPAEQRAGLAAALRSLAAEIGVSV